MPKLKPQPISELDDQIGFQLRLAQLAVFGDIIAKLKTCNLRPVDMSVLLLLDSQPGLRQHVIGDRLKIARPNVVVLIDSLVKRDLIERRVDANDRRANQLMLTPAGQAVLVQAKAIQDAHRARLIAALDGIDVDNFMEGLIRLTQIGKSGAGAHPRSALERASPELNLISGQDND